MACITCWAVTMDTSCSTERLPKITPMVCLRPGLLVMNSPLCRITVLGEPFLSQRRENVRIAPPAVSKREVAAQKALLLHPSFLRRAGAGDVGCVAAPGKTQPGPRLESPMQQGDQHLCAQALSGGVGANPHADL